MTRILVIDDDAHVRLTLQTVLTRSGFEVICASDGAEGLRLFRERAPDLVISDIIMPEQEGMATIKQAKSESPQTPIVAMSGGGRLGNSDILKLARAAGADDILAKPFVLADLITVVQRNLAPTA
jgi:DNA-binding response OmpR family regulator